VVVLTQLLPYLSLVLYHCSVDTTLLGHGSKEYSFFVPQEMVYIPTSVFSWVYVGCLLFVFQVSLRAFPKG
jgi:hypothetical protein